MDDAALYRRMLDNLGAWFRLAAGSPGGRVIEADGIIAAVTPAARYLSVFNGVVYEDAGALEAALPQLADAYDEAGVLAWTVWVPAADRDAAAVLEAAGHVLDASPTAMAVGLGDLELSAPEALDADTDATAEQFEALSIEGFGGKAEYARGAMSGFDGPDCHRHVARLHGRPVATVGVYDHQGDGGVYYVATLPEARGRGVATALMTRALLDAHERGCETTSLQATKLGRPIYERLDYRDLGAIEMWERRRSSAPA
jgi:GNAT superfamily N-acetyltransferase